MTYKTSYLLISPSGNESMCDSLGELEDTARQLGATETDGWSAWALSTTQLDIGALLA